MSHRGYIVSGHYWVEVVWNLIIPARVHRDLRDLSILADHVDFDQMKTRPPAATHLCRSAHTHLCYSVNWFAHAPLTFSKLTRSHVAVYYSTTENQAHTTWWYT